MNTTQSPSASAETSVSMTVINLVAQADGADPLETEPLYHAIDPDLLDSLPDAEGFSRLEFSYQGIPFPSRTATMASRFRSRKRAFRSTGRAGTSSTPNFRRRLDADGAAVSGTGNRRIVATASHCTPDRTTVARFGASAVRSERSEREPRGCER